MNINHHLVAGELLQLVAELVHFRAALTDHQAGTGRVDMDLGLAAGALEVNLGDTGVVQPLLDVVAQFQVLVKEVGIVLVLRVPQRRPILDHAEAEPVWMYLLTHSVLLYLSEIWISTWLLRVRMRAARPRGAG